MDEHLIDHLPYKRIPFFNTSRFQILGGGKGNLSATVVFLYEIGTNLSSVSIIFNS